MAIRYKKELLQQVAVGLNQINLDTLKGINVVLSEGVDVGEEESGEYSIDLVTFLDYLAEDVSWNEEANWSCARLARVEVL